MFTIELTKLYFRESNKAMNSVQRNYRKQMKKTLKKMKKENKEMYYNYIRKNHLHNPEQEETRLGAVGSIARGIWKLIKATGILLSVLLFLVLIAGIAGELKKYKNTDSLMATTTAKSVGSNLSISKQQDIINYLNQITPIENEIIGDLNKRGTDINSYNSKMMTAKEYLNNLIVYQNRIENNVREIDKINSSNELAAYKTQLQNAYKLIIAALQNEIKYYQTNNKNNFNEMQKQFKAFDEAVKNKNTVLNNILDKNGIKHN
jgi:hypothetical protein